MAGNCTAAIDPLGNRMEWTYDAAGNKTSEQMADGTVKKGYMMQVEISHPKQMGRVIRLYMSMTALEI